MKYNFDTIANRINTSSIKWDVKQNELPMWVADMDFVAIPEIQEAIINATKDGAFGYTYPTEDFFKSYQYWWKKRHHFEIPTSWIIFASGVVSALDSIVRSLTKENDGILLLTPVYHAFFNIINSNHRTVVTSTLLEKNNYSIDYQDVENKIRNSNVKALIFCNPHNPVGRIWSKEEINQLINICDKHEVYFISDEIHCDIADPGYEYCSALSVNDNVIACLSPGKVFNLAGLHSSVTVVKNEETRKKLQEAFYHDDIGEPNYFAIPANIAAYTKGEAYVNELNEYLFENKRYVSSFINEKLPQLRLVDGHATYLLWIDISAVNIRSDIFTEELRKQTGLILSPGMQFGDGGAYYLRMNIATSLEKVKDGMNRLKDFIDSKEK